MVDACRPFIFAMLFDCSSPFNISFMNIFCLSAIFTNNFGSFASDHKTFAINPTLLVSLSSSSSSFSLPIFSVYDAIYLVKN